MTPPWHTAPTVRPGLASMRASTAWTTARWNSSGSSPHSPRIRACHRGSSAAFSSSIGTYHGASRSNSASPSTTATSRPRRSARGWAVSRARWRGLAASTSMPSSASHAASAFACPHPSSLSEGSAGAVALVDPHRQRVTDQEQVHGGGSLPIAPVRAGGLGSVASVRRRTKIVATIGPASDAEATLSTLIEAGMDVARIGLAHEDLETHLERYDRIRKASVDADPDRGDPGRPAGAEGARRPVPRGRGRAGRGRTAPPGARVRRAAARSSRSATSASSRTWRSVTGSSSVTALWRSRSSTRTSRA